MTGGPRRPTSAIGPSAADFAWATGVEDTFVPQTRPGHRALDQYALIGHYEHWREDLALVRDLGVRWLRWGVPWYRVEPERGVFDWRWTDEVVPYLVDELGVTPIVDLMHYGCPLWLRREFSSDDYPAAVAAYAGALARRYGARLRWYTPFNEPLIAALLCGMRGNWPPYLRGERGYVRLLLQIAKGIVATVDALREAAPGARMVHVEAAGLTRSARQDLEVLAVEEQRRGYVVYDLLAGRLVPDHPLFAWLVRSGAHPDDLAAFAARPVLGDYLGLNFYPQWSTRQLFLTRRGRLASRPTEQDGAPFTALIADYHRRYGLPILVTETSAKGDLDVRLRWLEASVAAVRGLRAAGVPVLGYTWFPLFTMVDWRYRFGQRPVEDYRLELGLYALGGPGEPRWRGTPLADRLRELAADPRTVGELAAPPAPEIAT